MNGSVARAAPPGSAIGVVTSGSPPETRAEVQRGIGWCESKGYRVKLMPGALEDGWHAGSPEVRASDLQMAFADPEIDAIQTMRGGYGSARAIPLLDFDAIAETPKASWASPTSRPTRGPVRPRRVGDVLRPVPDGCRRPLTVRVHDEELPPRVGRRDDRPCAGGPRPPDGDLDRRWQGERSPGRLVAWSPVVGVATMHTIDSTETINRLLDLFPPQQQREVRTSFAGALRGIVSQRLVGRADGKGRVPAVEVLVATGRIYDRIIDPEATVEIRDIIAEGGFYGMQTFDQALVHLVEGGLVTEEDARLASTSPHDFVLALRGSLLRG